MNPATRPAPVPAATIERALAEAARDPDRIGDLLDELSRALPWLPLPDDEGPVTDGSAVVLPTVTYLGAEFVPAFVSARRLTDWHGAGEDVVPHKQGFPIDVTFSGEGEPDQVDDWIAAHADPFYLADLGY